MRREKFIVSGLEFVVSRLSSIVTGCKLHNHNQPPCTLQPVSCIITKHQ